MTSLVIVASFVPLALLLAAASLRFGRRDRTVDGLPVGIRQSGRALIFPPPSGDPLHAC